MNAPAYIITFSFGYFAGMRAESWTDIIPIILIMILLFAGMAYFKKVYKIGIPLDKQ